MLSSGANSSSLAEQRFWKGNPVPTFYHWLFQPRCRHWERAALITSFFNQSTGPNFPVSESGLISMEGSRFFSWIPLILWLWCFLYCSVWFLTPFPVMNTGLGFELES